MHSFHLYEYVNGRGAYISSIEISSLKAIPFRIAFATRTDAKWNATRGCALNPGMVGYYYYGKRWRIMNKTLRVYLETSYDKSIRCVDIYRLGIARVRNIQIILRCGVSFDSVATLSRASFPARPVFSIATRRDGRKKK